MGRVGQHRGPDYCKHIFPTSSETPMDLEEPWRSDKKQIDCNDKSRDTEIKYTNVQHILGQTVDRNTNHVPVIGNMSETEKNTEEETRNKQRMEYATEG